MRYIIKITIIIAILSSALYGSNYGTSTLKALIINPGARAAGMGGAFSAVGKDATALNYNVGGLGLVRAYDVSYMHLLYGGGVSYDYLGVAIPTDFGTFGININYFHFKLNDKVTWKNKVTYENKLLYHDIYATLGFAREFFNMMSVGISCKYINSLIGIKNVEKNLLHTIAFDMGFLFSFDMLRIKKIMKDPEKNFRFGISIKNLGPKAKYLSDRVSLPAELRAGIYYKPMQYFCLSYDMAMRYAFNNGMKLDAPVSHYIGVEVLPEWYLNFRGGVEISRKRTFPGFGIGGNVRRGTIKLTLDWAMTWDKVLGHKQWVSVTFSKFSASLAKFVFGEIDISDVFPAMYKFYSKDKIGTVKVKNNTDIPVEKIKLTFFVKEFMDFPSESKEISRLQPKKSILFEIPASFNSRVLEITEDTPMQAQVKVEYFAQGQKKLIQSSKSFKMFNRNAMVWDDIGKLSSFVTPKDTIVKVYARNLISSYKNKNIGDMNRNLFNAMLIFDALSATGVTYVLDPQSPLRQRETTVEVVDYIQFPRDTIRFKSGDCDDCTVLYCSLLENIGIQTALIDLQEHILMMFNTGVPESSASAIASSSKMYVIKDGFIWVPVETTLIGDSFSKAWQTGVSEYYKGEESKKVTIIDVTKAQATYSAVTLPEISWEPKMPSKYNIDKNLNKDIKFSSDIGMKNVLQKLKARLRSNPKDDELLNKLGVMLSKTGDTEQSIPYLEKAVKLKPEVAKYHNNLANAYFLIDEINKAKKEYETAINLDPENPKYYINFGTLLNYVGETEKAAAKFEKAEILLTK